MVGAKVDMRAPPWAVNQPNVDRANGGCVSTQTAAHSGLWRARSCNEERDASSENDRARPLGITVVEFSPTFKRIDMPLVNNATKALQGNFDNNVRLGAVNSKQWRACGPAGLCNCLSIVRSGFLIGIERVAADEHSFGHAVIDCARRHLIKPPTIGGTIGPRVGLLDMTRGFAPMVIDLQSNTLQSIPAGYFDSLRGSSQYQISLQGIELSDNLITQLPIIRRNDLLVLSLQFNKLTKLNLEDLSGVPNLAKLDLRNNLITEVTGASFPKLLALLDLRRNNIRGVSIGAVQSLPTGPDADKRFLHDVENSAVLSMASNASTTLCKAGPITSAGVSGLGTWRCCCALGYSDSPAIEDTRKERCYLTTPTNGATPSVFDQRGCLRRREGWSTTTVASTADVLGTRDTTLTGQSSGRSFGMGASVAVVLVLLLGSVGGAFVLHRSRRRRNELAVQAKLSSIIKHRARDCFVDAFPHLLRKIDQNCSAALRALDESVSLISLQRSAIDIGETMGNGRFGTRYFGTVRNDGTASNSRTARADAADATLPRERRVVVKVCHRGLNVTLDQRVQFVAEAYLMGSLVHKNILQIVGLVTSSLPMLTLTELMQNRDLKTFLRACRPTLQSKKEVLDVICLLRIGSLVVEACEFLGERKVVHRALMASNVLVGADHRDIRLTGLDSLRATSGVDYAYVKTSSTKDQLNIRWLAPESFSTNTFTTKSDVWSFGVLLWEVMSYARAPFGAFKASEIATEVLSGKRLERSPGCPQELFDCMNQCWHHVPGSRPGFAAIRGSLNMLLLVGADDLNAKVAQATKISALADLRWEIPAVGLEVVGVEPFTAGGLVEMVARNSAAAEIASVAAVTGTGAGAGDGVGAAPILLQAVRLPLQKRDSALALVARSTHEAQALRALFETSQDLHHRRLVGLIGCSTAVGFTVMFERPSLGSLFGPAAVVAPRSTVSAELRKKMALHVALGLEYLHANSLVHSAVCPHVVYVDAEYNAKLVAYMAQPASVMRPVARLYGRSATAVAAAIMLPPGPPAAAAAAEAATAACSSPVRWLAPEAVCESAATPAADVFSFGMVLWSLLAAAGGARLYPLVECDDAYVELVRSSGSIPPASAAVLGARPDVGSEFHTLFAGCTQHRPEERPTMANVATLLLDLVGGKGRWDVDRAAFVTIQKLGEGQFGDVVKMATSLFSEDGSVDFVAVKVLKAEGAGRSAAEMRADFRVEVDLMKRLRHPNLVSLLGECTEAAPFWAVLEFLKGGSLDQWLPANGHVLLTPTPTKLTHMLHQVALGCLALSQAGIIHRDLAARNLLVGSRLEVKVADYGLSRDVDEDRNYYRLTTERPLPIRWTAPESVVSLKWTSASDCYSYGVVVFEMFTCGAFPFVGLDDGLFLNLLASDAPLHTVLLAQMEATLAKLGVAAVPPIAKELVSRCMARDPQRRPTFADLARLTLRPPHGAALAPTATAAVARPALPPSSLGLAGRNRAVSTPSGPDEIV
jgi:serine/threonine protein kinase